MTYQPKHELDELKRAYLPKAEGARLYGYKLADMSRDELLAIAVWMCERECLKYQELAVRLREDRGEVNP